MPGPGRGYGAAWTHQDCGHRRRWRSVPTSNVAQSISTRLRERPQITTKRGKSSERAGKQDMPHRRPGVPGQPAHNTATASRSVAVRRIESAGDAPSRIFQESS